jgi:hypothetical protein
MYLEKTMRDLAPAALILAALVTMPMEGTAAETFMLRCSVQREIGQTPIGFAFRITEPSWTALRFRSSVDLIEGQNYTSATVHRFDSDRIIFSVSRRYFEINRTTGFMSVNPTDEPATPRGGRWSTEEFLRSVENDYGLRGQGSCRRSNVAF